MMTTQSIAGKYFINLIPLLTGGGQISRGKILGPVSHELSTFYLCEIYPPDESVLAIRAQTIFSIEQLSGIHLYDDKALWLAEWQQIIVRVRTAPAPARKRRTATTSSTNEETVE